MLLPLAFRLPDGGQRIGKNREKIELFGNLNQQGIHHLSYRLKYWQKVHFRRKSG
jgi:hypothetical protein